MDKRKMVSHATKIFGQTSFDFWRRRYPDRIITDLKDNGIVAVKEFASDVEGRLRTG